MLTSSLAVIIKLLASVLSGGILYRGFAPGQQALPATKIAGVMTSVFTILAFIVDLEGFFDHAPTAKMEQLFWQSIENTPTNALYCDYLQKYPNGQFKGIALVRLAGYVCPVASLDLPAESALSLDSFRAESMIKVTLNAQKLNGKAWDILAGQPDIYIVVNGTSYRSDRCEDALSCQFSVPLLLQPATIEVWDADEVEDDLAGSALCVPSQACNTHSAQIEIF
jgi:hypothetical protein